jgi:NitT/TauT family transport system substrate-binding protein
VEFKVLGWTEVQEALSSTASGKIDVGINNITAVITTHEKNPDLIYYYGFNTFDNGFALMIRPDGKLKPLKFFLDKGLPLKDAIRSCAQQLKGKTVVTTANTDMEQGVAAFAKKGDLNFMSDLKITNLNPDDGLASFLSGTGDAYIGGIPQRSKAAKEGMIEMITGNNIGPVPINGIVTTKEFAKNNPEALSKLLKVWFKIVNYTNGHLDEVAGTIAAQLNKNTASGFTAADFKKFWNVYEHYPNSPEAIQKDILAPSGPNYWKNHWDDCNNYFFNIKKAMKAPVPDSDAFYMIGAQRNLLTYLKSAK